MAGLGRNGLRDAGFILNLLVRTRKVAKLHQRFIVIYPRGFSLHHDAFAKAVVSPWLEDLNPLPSPLAQSRFFIEERELKHRIQAALFN